jgi:hypothetical protein
MPGRAHRNPSPCSSKPASVENLTKEQKKKLQKFYKSDQIAYTTGVCNLILTTAILSRYPQHFWVFHLMKAAVLLPARYFRFKQMKWSLYMIDFCYFETYLTALFCALSLLRVFAGVETVFSQFNENFFRTGFFFAFGPLAWAVVIFRNSIAFHNLDKMTEVFVHISPCLMFYSLRWGAGLGPSVVDKTWPGMFQICKDEAEFRAADACIYELWCTACPASLSDLFIVTPLVYIVFWGVPYYFLIFHVYREAIEKQGRATLYAQLCETKWSFLLKVPPATRPFAYILTHLGLSMCGACLAFVMWHCFWLHSLFLLGLIILGIHNGSTYVFSDLSFNYASKMLGEHAFEVLN